MPQSKRGIPAKGRLEVREEESSPLSSPRRRANDASSARGGARGRFESPNKSSHVARRPLTSEDIRAEASPIVPRGRGRPPSSKATPVANKVITDSAASPARRSRRITGQFGNEDMPTSSRGRLDSLSTIGSRHSPAIASPRRSRQNSKMEPLDEPSEGSGYDDIEGRGKRKRKLTEAAEAAQAQTRSRKSSRRISERQQLDDLEPIHEELAEPIEEFVGEEVLDEVAHEEMVHAVSPHDMYMQPHLIRPVHSVMGRTTRGMHVVADDDDLLDQHLVEEEDDALHEMAIYDDDGNLIGYGEEMAHEEIIEGEEGEEVDEEELLRSHHGQQLMETGRHRMMPQHEMKEEQQTQGGQEDDDDLPPQLEPEEGPAPEEIIMHENMERGQMQADSYEEQGGYIAQSPGGTQYYQEPGQEDEMFVDGMDPSGMMQMDDGGDAAVNDLRTVEFNFLDNKHICCGMCGEIVPYDNLLREHLPLHHPEVYGDGGNMDLEEISYDSWLKDKLSLERKNMENGFRTIGYVDQQQSATTMSRQGRNTRVLRRVSQVRVNPNGMTLAQLETALKRKMIEKMGRRVKVTLVDKQHARCGICNAVVSLNKKFEVIHLVRHFNAWHPSSHRCAGTWPNRTVLNGPGKPLSSQDFAVVDVALDAPESLQCIWCGMFMDRTMLAMHFHEVHADDVEVPKCHLCLQEVVINARLAEKYGEDFEITLPDEHHIRCAKVQGSAFSTEAALDRCIDRRINRMRANANNEAVPEEDEGEEDDEGTDDHLKDAQYSNSRMAFGRRNKPKRNFIMPSLRQAIPQDSRYVEALSEGQWRCKLCGDPILAAVISAGAIKHYRQMHKEQLEDMQYELCKARLERVSDGCMEFVHPELIECLICNMTYALHKPYNMCRGIRHLKTKHPEMMPEYNKNGMNSVPTVAKKPSQYQRQVPQNAQPLEMGEFIEDPEIISKLKEEYDIDFDKVQTMYGPDGQQVYVLVSNGQEVDAQVAENIQASIREQPVEGEEEEEETAGEGGVIIEEEEYQMEDEIVVRDADVRRRNYRVRRHQMDMVAEEEEEVSQEDAPQEEQEEMGEELAEHEEEHDGDEQVYE